MIARGICFHSSGWYTDAVKVVKPLQHFRFVPTGNHPTDCLTTLSHVSRDILRCFFFFLLLLSSCDDDKLSERFDITLQLTLCICLCLWFSGKIKLFQNNYQASDGNKYIGKQNFLIAVNFFILITIRLYLFYLQMEKVGWFNWSSDSMPESRTSEPSFPWVAPELAGNLTRWLENQDQFWNYMLNNSRVTFVFQHFPVVTLTGLWVKNHQEWNVQTINIPTTIP